MKKSVLAAAVVVLATACTKDNINHPQSGTVDCRQEMRNFVRKISLYAKGTDEHFLVIPQNGQEILTHNGEPGGKPVAEYLAVIDGTGREDLFYGYEENDEPTPEDERKYLTVFCDVCEQNNIEVLVTDYCRSHDKIDDSYILNHNKGYISFAAPERELNIIPDYPLEPFHISNRDMTTIHDAKNFLYLINPGTFATKQDFIDAVSATDYDLIIMDCFFNDQAFSAGEIEQLKVKQNGGKRLVVSYMSIGEAEDYRYYWRKEWKTNPPDWLAEENPDWEGNYRVKYWDEDWQNIICCTDSSYLKKLLDSGFDGVYLDVIDAFEYFEGLH